MGLFLVICFCKTSYATKKFESCVGMILKYKMPQSSFSGLKVRSLSRWHIDSCIFYDQNLGLYKAQDILLELKLWPLIFGQYHLHSLMIEDLLLEQDPDTPLNPAIFNHLYQNKKLLIQKVCINHLHLPRVTEELNLHFYKKDFLSFCTIYDLNFKNKVHFEIIRKSSFLKFKLNLSLDLATLGTIEAKGEGFINQTSVCHLKGLCKFNYCHQTTPFELDLGFDQTLSCQGLIDSAAAQGHFNYKQEFLHAHLEMQDLKSLFPLSHLNGQMSLSMNGPLNNLEILGSSEKLYFKRKALAPCQLFIPSIDRYQTELQASFLNHTSQTFNLNALISSDDLSQKMRMNIQGPSLQALVSIEKTGTDLSRLCLDAHCDDAHMFEGFFDELPLQGKGHLVLNFAKQDQLLEILGSCHDVKIGAYHLNEASISYQNSPSIGACNFDLKKFQSPYFAPVDLSIKGHKENHWNLLTHLSSSFFDFTSAHELSILDKTYKWHILDLEGHYQDHPARLNHPIIIKHSKDECSITPFELFLGEGSFKGAFNKQGDHIIANSELQSMNLSGFKLPYFDAPLEGSLSCSVHLDTQNKVLSKAELSVESLTFHQQGSDFPPLFIQGELQLLDDEMARYNLNAYFSNDDYFFSHGLIPFGGSKQQPFHQLAIKFKLDDLGQVLNLGSNSLGGKLKADLTMNKNSERYFTTGTIHVDNLHASFPFLGIYLDQGHFFLQPNGDKAPFHIELKDLTSGSAQGTGTLNLSDFSYSASLQLDQLFLNFKNLFQSHLSGPLQVKGNFHQIQSCGSLALSKASYLIDHPSLKKTKSYKIERFAEDLPKEPITPFIYNLKFQASSADDLSIRGIGLDSAWQGHSECLIKNNYFSLDGLLNCQKGEIRFQTKKIIIDEGLIHLTHHNPSTISAKGHLDIPTHQIKVALIGPLKEPKIQFSSLPALSESAIISYILFNKPLSELHPLQSIELAQTLLELSGHQTPFSLAKLRSHLNIDALDLKTSENDNKSLTLYVGKYITPELLIGLFQSKKTSDVLLQLELKHGFLLKAESKDQKEGKFSLKWNKNF